MANTVNKVIAIAEAEVGYLEKKSKSNLDSKTANAGSKNYTKYWRDLAPGSQGQSWCQCFIDWVFNKAYGTAIAKKLLLQTAGWSYYTPTAAGYFKNKKQWYSAPQIGDLIYFKNSARIHHVGLVYKVDAKNVYTIEGNTSSGSAVVANGGGVFKKQYALANSSIAGYGRPKYDVESPSVGNYDLVFNATYYVNKYPDLKAAFGTNATLLLQHFKANGIKEGRQACATFNVVAYKANNADLRTAFGNAGYERYVQHYLEFGHKENRKCV